MQIAVLVDQKNHVAAFEQGGIVKLYENQHGAWRSIKEYPYQIDGLGEPSALWNRLSELCRWMEPCVILAARRFRGTYRVILERHEISMWEMDGFSSMGAEDFLDDIEEFHANQKDQECCTPAGSGEPVVPTEQNPGCYTIDLTDVMQHRTSLNSQQILLPFFRNTSFKSLEIICDHVPKWFERELFNYNLKTEVLEQRGRLHVYLIPESQ